MTVVMHLALFLTSLAAAAASESRRTVLVTGGARGIGQAVCERFAANGDRVIVHFRTDEEQAKRVRASLPGSDHICLRAALDEPGAPARLFEAALAECGHVDVCVINHGVYEEYPVESTSPDVFAASFEKIVRTNLGAPAELAYAFGTHIRTRDVGGGAIVFVSSRGAYRGEPLALAYGASKAGLNSLTGSLAQAFGPYGVRVAAVAPGFIATEMAASVLASERGDGIRAQSPWGRVGKPDDVASAVFHLASHEGLWSTGAVLDCNGASYLH
jgi:3-oxoacyl-[acyl-carrier protein] reductase